MGAVGRSEPLAPNNKRIQNSFSSPSAPCVAAPKHGSISDHSISRNGSDNKKLDEGRNFGVMSRNSQFFIYPLFNSEKRWHYASYFQPKKTESVSETNQIPTDFSSSNPRVFTTKRLVDKNRLDTGLLSRTCSTLTSSFLKTNLQGTNITNDLFTLWNVDSAQSVCSSNKLDCRSLKRPRDTNRCIPRRFLSRESGQIETRGTNSSCSQDLTNIRLGGERRKINPNSPKVYRIFRSGMGPVEKYETTTSKENSRHKSYGYEVVETTKRYDKGSPEIIRDPELCPIRCTLRKTKLSLSSYALQRPAAKKDRSNCPSSRSRNRGVKLVETKLRQVRSSTSTASYPFPNNRCSGCGLGSRAEWCASSGKLGRRRRTCSFESKRNVNHSEVPRAVRSLSDSCISSPSMRQQIRCSISEKRRGMSFNTTNEVNLQNFQNSSPIQYSLDSTSHPWNVQQCSRSPLSKSSASRVAPPPTPNKYCVSKMGRPRSRSVCITSSPRSTKVRQLGSERPCSLETQRLCMEMGFQTGMGVPPAESYPEGAATSQSCDGNLHNNSAEMASDLLESRPEVARDRSPIHSGPVRNQTHRHVNGTSSPESTENDTRDMEMWGWSKTIESWSAQQKSLLRAGWRKSTLNTYRPAWTQWLRWCHNSNINPTHPQGSDLAQYLADLHIKKNLAYRTILVHKSVISTLCNTEDSSRLSSNVLVKQILKSIATIDAMNRSKPNIWDANVLTSWLSNNIPQVQNLWEVSRRCAILLLLCSGRRVHDLTLLSVAEGSFIDDKETNCLTFWPMYGSKTDSASFSQSGWKLHTNRDNVNIDPVFWVRKLVQISTERRNEAKLNNLFITIRGPAKAASRTVISGWAKSILSEAGIDATPGSVRSAVASRGWIDKEPIDKILARANWRSENTFFKFYKKEIKSIHSNSNVTLGSLFEPLGRC